MSRFRWQLPASCDQYHGRGTDYLRTIYIELGGIERARKRAVRTARKPPRQRDQPARQTGVARIGRTEFGVGPVTVMVVVYRRQWRVALRELHAS
jgi:hypothetical protein